MNFQRFVGFIVWEVSNRSGTGEQPIAGANARMIGELGAHSHFADGKFHVFNSSMARWLGSSRKLTGKNGVSI